MATNHLIACGYRKIACIAGPQNKTTARHRLDGYRNAMRRASLPVPLGYEEYTATLNLKAWLTRYASTADAE